MYPIWSLLEDVAFAESRIRGETIAAEDPKSKAMGTDLHLALKTSPGTGLSPSAQQMELLPIRQRIVVGKPCPLLFGRTYCTTLALLPCFDFAPSANLCNASSRCQCIFEQHRTNSTVLVHSGMALLGLLLQIRLHIWSDFTHSIYRRMPLHQVVHLLASPGSLPFCQAPSRLSLPIHRLAATCICVACLLLMCISCQHPLLELAHACACLQLQLVPFLAIVIPASCCTNRHFACTQWSYPAESLESLAL